MQPHRRRFYQPDGGKYGSLQSCLRTDDIELVGDGSHLTYFEMMGNFSFGGEDYECSVELWHSIVTDLKIPVTEVRVHPSRGDHNEMWTRHGYTVIDDESCIWSDGKIGGNCCELFCGELEIGNLVNPLGHATDVGFGWERLHQVVERCQRVDQTSLFDQRFPPVVSDHLRTISILHENGIHPGNKGRHYVCRRIIRRILSQLSVSEQFEFNEWIEQECHLKKECLRNGRRSWKKFRNRPPSFWWETFGILPEEIDQLK